jgi:RNA polymerase sigma factor (sigma-70 family)
VRFVTIRSDLELLRDWRAGDTDAGSKLFERHFDSIYAFFLVKVGDAAEDLVQQTFTACARRCAGYRGEASFRAYLLGIARNELYEWLHRRHRDLEHERIGALCLEDLGPTPSGVVARKDDARMLLDALRRLPLEQQIVVELFYFERLRGRDLVAALGISEGTIRSRLRLALVRLRRDFASLGGAGAALATTLTNLDDWAREVRRARSEDKGRGSE